MKTILLTLAATVAVAGSTLAPFSTSAVNADGTPAGWRPLLFEKIGVHTIYTVVSDEGKTAVRADAKKSASGLIFETDADADARLSWSWKIVAPVEKSAIGSKAGDDAAARVYVAFAHDPARLPIWTAFKNAAIELIYGSYPPSATINYVWANTAPVGATVTSPYTERVKIVVVESGAAKAGTWVTESVDIAADYRRLFGEEPPPVNGIGIMTDTDNTQGEATAWYADFSLAPEGGNRP
jgi:hypothetical protein